MPSDRRPAAQSVRNAWINALRNETLRIGTPEMARVAHVGHMIATYADADGGGAFPSQETLATLVGGTDEAVARAVRVLIAVGILAKKRRPNATAVYQLLMPVGKKLDWAAHMPLYTETRQKRARARQKALAAEALASRPEPVPGRHPEPVPGGNPEPVPGLESGTRPGTASEDSEPVLGRPRNPSCDGFRNPSQAGGTSTPTSGRDPEPHQTLPDLPPQPQVRAGARGENDQLIQPPHPERAIACEVPGCRGTVGLPCTGTGRTPRVKTESHPWRIAAYADQAAA